MVDVQTLIAAPLVAACFVYTGWTLAPAAVRRAVALQMRRIGALARWAPLRAATTDEVQACAGCDGCIGTTRSRTAGGAGVITLRRRRPH